MYWHFLEGWGLYNTNFQTGFKYCVTAVKNVAQGWVFALFWMDVMISHPLSCLTLNILLLFDFWSSRVQMSYDSTSAISRYKLIFSHLLPDLTWLKRCKNISYVNRPSCAVCGQNWFQMQTRTNNSCLKMCEGLLSGSDRKKYFDDKMCQCYKR